MSAGEHEIGLVLAVCPLLAPYDCFVQVLLLTLGRVYVPGPPSCAKYILRNSSVGKLNTLSPKRSKLIVPRKVTLVRLQPPNATLPIEVTPLPMVTLVRLKHPENAPLPIEVTLLGMVTLVMLVQPFNAKLPIEVTLLGIVMLVIASRAKTSVVTVLLYNTPFWLE